MWNPIKIEFENLFSHKRSEHVFANDACTVIFGRNKTDKSLDNNGAGKSTLFEAICIALTGDSLRSIKKDAFINREESVCRIRFELYNAVMRKKLTISRAFYRTKTSQVEVYENDVLNDQLTSVNEANKYILDLIGVSREDLLRYYIIGQDNTYTFFTASDVDKKEIMNRITSADAIAPAIEELARRNSEVQNEIFSEETAKSKLDERIETLNEQLEELERNSDAKRRIEEKLERIKRREETIKQKEKEKGEWNSAFESLRKEIGEKKRNAVDVTEATEIRKKTNKQIETLEEQITENKRVRMQLQTELQGTVTCPNCGEEFMPKSKLGVSVEEGKKLLKQVEEELAEQVKKLEKLESLVEQKTKEIRAAQREEEIIHQLISRKDSLKRRIDANADDISRELHCIETLKKDIEEIRNEDKNDSVRKGIKEKIAAAKESSAKKDKILEGLYAKLEMIKFWQFNMGKSGFTTYLANRSVKIIEGITNSYLRKFGVDISVLINGFKVLKNGEVREKIDVFVTNDGLNAEQFLAKSGGERGRVILAGILGIQHLINVSTNGRGLNLLVLDEALSGIDANGTLEIIKTIEHMGTTVLMITQNIEDVSICKNYIEVVKENGVSRYIS